MEWLYWLGSYILGTFLTAYFVSKRKGIDLGNEGSGNLGARNIGRVVGKWAFVITMLGDALKGAIVVMVGHLLEFSTLIIAIGLFLTVVGHVYPFWRKFKGGKGVATGIGGLIFVIPLGAPLLLIGFLIMIALTRSATIGMLGAFAVYAGYFIYEWTNASIAIFAVILMVIWANRENIMEKFKK